MIGKKRCCPVLRGSENSRPRELPSKPALRAGRQIITRQFQREAEVDLGTSHFARVRERQSRANFMSRNYELIRKAADAIHAHRETGKYIPPLSSGVPIAEMGTASEHPRDLDVNILNLLQAIIRRRNWINLWTLIMLAAAGLVCVLMTPQYKAESRLEILKQDTSGLSLNTGGASDVSSDPLDFNMTLQTQLAVLKSDVLAWQVMKELKLVDGKDLTFSDAAAASASTDAGNPPPAKAPVRALKTFKASLKVNAISGTRLIAVSYMHPDPNMAAKIVNQLVSDFVEYNFQVRYNATTKATDWLRPQPVGLQSQVE